MAIDVEVGKGKMTISQLIEAIQEEIRERYPEFKIRIAGWFAYAMLYRPKYTLTHDDDPPWDHSGRLYIKCLTNPGIQYLTPYGDDMEKFTVANYNKLGDFLSEYTGQSNASFVSGCGLFYQTYEEDLRELVENWIDECLLEVFSQKRNRVMILQATRLDPDIPISSVQELFDFIDDVDTELEGEPLMMLRINVTYEMVERLSAENAQELLSQGLFEARKRHKQEITTAEQARLVEQANQSRAQELTDVMIRYLESLGIVLLRNSSENRYSGLRTIEKKTTYWKQVRSWLLELNETDKALVLKYGPFSNSIKEGRW
ncbi:MAG: hypothetical protein AB1489_42460 [Acidobacteriota bacterium]